MTAETYTRSGPILEVVCIGTKIDWRGREEAGANAVLGGKTTARPSEVIWQGYFPIGKV